MKQDHWYKVSNPIQIQTNHFHHTHCNSNEALVHSLKISMFLLHNPSNSFTQSSLDAMLQRFQPCERHVHKEALSTLPLRTSIWISLFHTKIMCIAFSVFFLVLVTGDRDHNTLQGSTYVCIYTSWWFQAIWKTLVQFPEIGLKIKYVWNHHLDIPTICIYLHSDNANWCLLAATKPTSCGQFF